MSSLSNYFRHREWNPIIMVLILSLTQYASSADYCAICPDHTMCQFSGVASSCLSGVSVSGVGSADQATVLDVHNSLRNKVASGKETGGSPGPQPGAANMQRLVWDDELASVAQRWVDQCNYKHDACRDVARFRVGQNIAIASNSPCTNSSDTTANWPKTIQSWYDEVNSMDKSQAAKFTGTGGVGHYTQVVWATTTYIGCGYRLFQQGKNCRRFYACNYGEGGNMKGRSIYIAGAARSQCTKSAPADSKYPALC